MALVGLFMSLTGWLALFGIPIAFAGVLLFLHIKGVVIDLEGRTVQSYMDFLVLKVGPPIPLAEFDRIELVRYNRSQHVVSRAHETNLTARTYDVNLVSKELQAVTELGAFESRKEAQTFAEKMEQALVIPLINKLPPIPDPSTRRR